MKEKHASGLIRMYMRACGFRGWTSLWNTIYYTELDPPDWLKRHERKHLEQMERDGKVKYMLKYIYFLIRYGYKDNPYECEARLAEIA